MGKIVMIWPPKLKDSGENQLTKAIAIAISEGSHVLRSCSRLHPFRGKETENWNRFGIERRKGFARDHYDDFKQLAPAREIAREKYGTDYYQWPVARKHSLVVAIAASIEADFVLHSGEEDDISGLVQKSKLVCWKFEQETRNLIKELQI